MPSPHPSPVDGGGSRPRPWRQRMSTEATHPTQTPPPAPSPLALLTRKDVLSGLMFIGIALLGLWLSRNYPIGTSLRMGTGYVPRLLCWILLGLGVIVL